MSEGDAKLVKLPAHKTFGTQSKELVFVVDKEKFKDSDPKLGAHYRIRSSKGDGIKVRVTEMKDIKVKLVGNHLSAGNDIFYYIELV